MKNASVEVVSAELPADFVKNYQTGTTLKDIYTSLQGKEPMDKTTNETVSRLIPHFEIHNDVLYYEGKICVPRANVRDVMHLAHDEKEAGHFGYTKTLARFESYHSKFKSSDVFDY